MDRFIIYGCTEALITVAHMLPSIAYYLDYIFYALIESLGRFSMQRNSGKLTLGQRPQLRVVRADPAAYGWTF